MESFLGIKWKDYGKSVNSVPETFILGSFLQGLNDPVHHKEFGLYFKFFFIKFIVQVFLISC